MYIDVHTHLTHQKFSHDISDVIARATNSDVLMVVNGLEPKSNRIILELSKQYPNILPALGIYPLDAINHLGDQLPFPIEPFNVDDEIAFIKTQAMTGKIAAVGECGLDGHWVDETTFPAQERVFEALIQVAIEADLPLIIHTRKLEKRSMEILEYHKVKKVDFHCYGGKSKLAIDAATNNGWYFSIPANARKNQSFAKLLKDLPKDRILTETDAPYLAPEKGERNEPINVIGTVAFLAELRNWSHDEAKNQIWENFQRLFVKTLQPNQNT